MNAARKKVLVIHHSGLLGGAGKSLVDLCRGLSPSFDVKVYLPAAPGQLAEHVAGFDIDAVTFDFRMAKIPYYSGGEPLWHPRTWYYVLSIPLQRRLWTDVIAAENPDVVIANSSVLSWLTWCGGRQIKVLMVRETLRGRASSCTNRLLRAIRERFDYVFYLSRHDLDADGLRTTCAAVVPDSVEPEDYKDQLAQQDARAALGLDPERPVALFLGGSNRLKGLDLLLAATRASSTPGLQVIVAGSPPEATDSVLANLSGRRRFDRRVLRLLSEIPPSRRVHFVGVREDVGTLFSACDCVVFPMKRPHQARPAFEAGFFGKPIIITDFSNISECVQHEQNGMLFPPGDWQALADSMDRLLQDSGLRQRLGSANREHALQMHTNARVYEHVKSMLETAIRRPGRTRDREQLRHDTDN